MAWIRFSKTEPIAKVRIEASLRGALFNNAGKRPQSTSKHGNPSCQVVLR